jgi:hypothetical protein
MVTIMEEPARNLDWNLFKLHGQINEKNMVELEMGKRNDVENPNHYKRPSTLGNNYKL